MQGEAGVLGDCRSTLGTRQAGFPMATAKWAALPARLPRAQARRRWGLISEPCLADQGYPARLPHPFEGRKTLVCLDFVTAFSFHSSRIRFFYCTDAVAVRHSRRAKASFIRLFLRSEQFV